MKWIVEFSFPVDSKKNTMIQNYNLMLYLTRKYLEIENGSKNDFTTDVKNIFRVFNRKINAQLIYNRIQTESGRNLNYYNDFIQGVCISPSDD